MVYVSLGNVTCLKIPRICYHLWHNLLSYPHLSWLSFLIVSDQIESEAQIKQTLCFSSGLILYPIMNRFSLAQSLQVALKHLLHLCSLLNKENSLGHNSHFVGFYFFGCSCFYFFRRGDGPMMLVFVFLSPSRFFIWFFNVEESVILL